MLLENGKIIVEDLNATSSDCRKVSQILARIGDRWSMGVIISLWSGSRRFNEIRRRTEGISQRMLTLTLKRLERDGMVTRTVFPTVPPKVDYELTNFGRSFSNPIIELGMWIHANIGEIEFAHATFDRHGDEK